MKKTILSLLFTVVMSISLIGCATKEDTEVSTAVEEVAEVEETEKVEEIVETEKAVEVEEVSEEKVEKKIPGVGDAPRGKIEITTENFYDYFRDDEYYTIEKNNFGDVEHIKLVKRFILKEEFETSFDPEKSNLDVEVAISYTDIDVDVSSDSLEMLSFNDSNFKENKVISFFHEPRGYAKKEKPIWYGVISLSQWAPNGDIKPSLSNCAKSYEVLRVAGHIYLR